MGLEFGIDYFQEVVSIKCQYTKRDTTGAVQQDVTTKACSPTPKIFDKDIVCHIEKLSTDKTSRQSVWQKVLVTTLETLDAELM